MRRLLRNERRAGFLLSEAPRGKERYRLADRGRYAVGELAASARFEHLNMPGTAVPIAVDDVVDALRAHLPLLELPAGLEGVCEFAAVGDPGRRNGVALAWAEVGHGRVVANVSGRPPRPADTWARGTIGQWMAALIEHRRDGIRAAGERPLGRADRSLASGLQSCLNKGHSTYRRRRVALESRFALQLPGPTPYRTHRAAPVRQLCASSARKQPVSTESAGRDPHHQAKFLALGLAGRSSLLPVVTPEAPLFPGGALSVDGGFGKPETGGSVRL
jgi:hypothetical protein